jgi:hypothetical protein
VFILATYVPRLENFLKNIHFSNMAEEFYCMIFSNFFLTFKDEIYSEIQGFFSDTKARSLKLAFYPKIHKALPSPKSSNKGQKRKKNTSKFVPNKRQRKKKKFLYFVLF